MRAGGRWRCRIRKRETTRKAQERYAATDKGRAVNSRYRQSAKGRETGRESASRRLFAGGIYLGACGFTKREREAMLSGPSD